MKIYFDHEKLEAYQQSLKFAAWCNPILKRLPKTAALHDQLDRARTSIVLNIAEGNGKFTAPDRCRYLDNARGSALESAGCVDLLKVDGIISADEVDEGKSVLRPVVAMLIGLIRSNNPDRFCEEGVEYTARTQ